jgi:hypothetical protein
MMTVKDGTHTTNIEKKNSNTVERETLQCDKIKSKRDNNHILNEIKKWRKQQMAKEYRETDDRET